MRTLLVLVETLAVLYGPLAVAVSLSMRRARARGVDPNPTYPGDQPLISAGSVVFGVLAGVVILVAISGWITSFNDWVLSLGFY